MEKQEIVEIVEKQRAFFLTGKTLPVCNRIDALSKLEEAIKKIRKK